MLLDYIMGVRENQLNELATALKYTKACSQLAEALVELPPYGMES